MQYAAKQPAEYKPRFAAKKRQAKANKPTVKTQYKPKNSCERKEQVNKSINEESTYSSSPSDKSASSSIERDTK